MPELPEVEITRRGIESELVGNAITSVTVRNPALRWPVSPELRQMATGQRVCHVSRRGKYLLIGVQTGTILVHLGMSGSLRLLSNAPPASKHDHVDFLFTNDTLLRLRDPRRFGAVLWTSEEPLAHPLLNRLGPEPLGAEFDADWLYARSRGRRVSIKPFIMDGRTVVGVGNIYASEALFHAGIHPARAAGRVSRKRYAVLVGEIRNVLRRAIEQGGTTLRDFTDSDGEPGYFARHLSVYGRLEQPCERCSEPISQRKLGQRSTFYCKICQR